MKTFFKFIFYFNIGILALLRYNGVMNRRKFLAYLSLTPIISTELLADNDGDNDVYLTHEEFKILLDVDRRLKRVKKHVGYAHFNLITLDKVFYFARNYSSIGAFTKEEIAFIDRLFHEDPNKYGFFGVKTCSSITNEIDTRKVKKIPHTGHYLFKGKSEEDYKRIINDVGDTLILTSGIRNVVKQLSLYINKIYSCQGNMTKATIQLAPPAYSYHTISDFDVGRKDWGYKNFTAEFATTDEFRRMRKLPYIGMRYKRNNKDGVRFEPWHVEVI